MDTAAQRRQYELVDRILGALICGLPYGLVAAVIYGLLYTPPQPVTVSPVVVTSIIYTVVGGLLGALGRGPESNESHDFGTVRFVRAALTGGVIVGLVVGVLYGLLRGWSQRRLYAAASAGETISLRFYWQQV